MVDARVRVYHKDGTRTYNEYKPFKPRTVENLAGYQPPKELPKLSKYGGNTNFKEEASGFFYVKKIGDRWWGIDPLGYRYTRKYLDIVSNNYYNHWTPDSTQMAEWAEWTGRPFIITEYYTKGKDSGMGNTSGAGWIVRTQEDRGLFYQNYNLALLESKNCVGWHYFKYIDNDPDQKGVDPSNVDANKGIVSNRYVPWTPMLDKMKEMNTQVYNLVEHFDTN